MAAECYWCSTGDDDLGKSPLGTCSDCWVFACVGHAERDQNLGKWKCFDGVAKLVTAAAGLDDPDEIDDLPIRTSEELSERFPRIAAATEAERVQWSQRKPELVKAVMRAAPERVARMQQIDPSMALLGHAVGVVRHFLTDVRGLEGGPPLVTGRLGKVVEQL